MIIKKLIGISVLLCSLVLFSNKSEAQVLDVVASSGGYLKGNKVAISFTLGEPFIKSEYTQSMICTQGFQQPRFTITAVDDLPNLIYTIKAYPNPATDFVNLSTSKTLPPGSYYCLSDIHGSRIDEKAMNGLTTRISFQELVPAIYFLQVRSQTKILRTFKIIKR